MQKLADCSSTGTLLDIGETTVKQHILPQYNRHNWNFRYRLTAHDLELLRPA